MLVINGAEVAAQLDRPSCIGLMREAMIALSQAHADQPLRSILALGDGNMFGVMPGSLDAIGFGAKLVSVFPSAAAHGRSHQGVIALFDPATGALAGIVDAEEVTKRRTACASAAATDALARPDARRLAILGTGEQAWQHALTIPLVRPVDHIAVWGRNNEKARGFADRLAARLAIPVVATPSAADAARSADIICTTTAADEPILTVADVAEGTHLNVVGSSRPGPMEIDIALVARARFIPDHRPGVLAQGAEYLAAKAAGLVGESHVLPEIGCVFAGQAAGRLTKRDITIYKSLGSIVQDLSCARFLIDRRHAGDPVIRMSAD